MCGMGFCSGHWSLSPSKLKRKVISPSAVDGDVRTGTFRARAIYGDEKCAVIHGSGADLENTFS